MVQSKSMTKFTIEAYTNNKEMQSKRSGSNLFRPIVLATALAFVGTGIVISIQTDAHAYCYKPTPPNKPYSFSSNDQINDYNRRVDSYNKELDAYRACSLNSYESYETRFKEYLRCEARSFGQAYSGCSRPAPPR